MFAKLLIVAAVMMIIIVVGVIVLDSNRFVMREYTIETNKLNRDHDFLFISDLHCKAYGKDNKKLLSFIDGLDVEGCLIAGDMITAKKGYKTDVAENLLYYIAKKMPIYYSEGNHEHRARIFPDEYDSMFENYERNLLKQDIIIRNNEHLDVDDLSMFFLSADRVFYQKRIKVSMNEDYITKKVGNLCKERFNILLAHNPEYFDAYVSFGADIILSGHYHGGIARLPILGGVISPRFKLFPHFDGGIFEKNGKKMLLSRGLGSHSIPIRFNNPGEIIVIHLKSIEK